MEFISKLFLVCPWCGICIYRCNECLSSLKFVSVIPFCGRHIV